MKISRFRLRLWVTFALVDPTQVIIDTSDMQETERNRKPGHTKAIMSYFIT